MYSLSYFSCKMRISSSFLASSRDSSEELSSPLKKFLEVGRFIIWFTDVVCYLVFSSRISMLRD